MNRLSDKYHYLCFDFRGAGKKAEIIPFGPDQDNACARKKQIVNISPLKVKLAFYSLYSLTFVA